MASQVVSPAPTPFKVRIKLVGDEEVQVVTLMSATAAAPTVTVASVSSVQLLPTSATRVNASVVNDSAATLYLTFNGRPATPTDWDEVLNPGDRFMHDVAPGLAINGVWSSVDGQARITEYT